MTWPGPPANGKPGKSGLPLWSSKPAWPGTRPRKRRWTASYGWKCGTDTMAGYWMCLSTMTPRRGNDATGLADGVRAAGRKANMGAALQIYSSQTEHARRGKVERFPAQRVIVDEVHLQSKPTAQAQFAGHLEDRAVVPGLTATPLDLLSCSCRPLTGHSTRRPGLASRVPPCGPGSGHNGVWPPSPAGGPQHTPARPG